ncbi:MAG: hypothetical protein A2170_10255 [Deltaproteobacteria bacterium RBG_13_53_10]|nr:MAG: hypothetical protein A2170_10255 [Deltaproteobacteria bacterium RBG_13_53_10]
MSTLQAISISVIAAIMVVAVITLIPVLLQVRRTAREAEKVLETVRTQILPLSHDLTVVSTEVKAILESIHRQVERAEDSIIAVRDSAERLRDFEEEVLDRFGAPLFKLATVVGAVSRGVEVFFRTLLLR